MPARQSRSLHCALRPGVQGPCESVLAGGSGPAVGWHWPGCWVALARLCRVRASRCWRVARAELPCSPGPDAGGVSSVPVQMWQRRMKVAAQMWQGCTQSVPVQLRPNDAARTLEPARSIALFVRRRRHGSRRRTCICHLVVNVEMLKAAEHTACILWRPSGLPAWAFASTRARIMAAARAALGVVVVNVDVRQAL